MAFTIRPMARSRSLRPLLLLAAVLAAPPASGQQPSGTERLEQLFARVRAEQAKLETLSADFVQRKESELFVEPQEARGTFHFKAPDKIRWSYASPDPMEVVVDQREMLTWYRDLGRAERVRIGRYADRVLEYMGASNSLDSLVEYFTVRVSFPTTEGDPYRLHLVPRYKRISRHLASMTLWLDGASYVPVRLRYEEPGGDVTDYHFENLRRNHWLPDETFRLDLPPEVEVRTVDLERGG
jgi:outer membrane lipoprotein-sorting protein